MTKVTTRPDKPPTLMMYYPHLDAKERALILAGYNKWRAERAENAGPEVHLGLLPFISMSKIGTALTWMANNETVHRRVWARLCSKVEAARWATGENYHYPAHQSWKVHLHNASVYKHFGRRPDLGVTIPLIPKEKCRGPLKWNIGAKAWQPETIQAAPRITLIQEYRVSRIHKGHGDWIVHAPTRYKELIIGWLTDHCY
jgi:hypothetical protein